MSRGFTRASGSFTVNRLRRIDRSHVYTTAPSSEQAQPARFDRRYLEKALNSNWDECRWHNGTSCKRKGLIWIHSESVQSSSCFETLRGETITVGCQKLIRGFDATTVKLFHSKNKCRIDSASPVCFKLIKNFIFVIQKPPDENDLGIILASYQSDSLFLQCKR